MLGRRYIVLFLSVLLIGCNNAEKTDTAVEIEQLDATAIENVYRLSPRIITGGEPDGEAGFAELRELGVTTIVSVTDAAPDTAAARKYGLEYVHVPMDYGEVSAEQRERILGAAGGAAGSVYLHCNSGRNRGATAAALCLIGVEGASHEEALSWMETRGVDAEKQELFDSVRGFTPEPVTGEGDH